LNIANKLTLLRIILIPCFVAVLQIQNITAEPSKLLLAHLSALIIFVIAALTDLLDGYYARRYSLVTNFGKLMDPLADKLLTMSAFVSFVEMRLDNGQPIFPAWATIVILGREFLVTGLRALALERARVIQADSLGKHKTIWQLIGISTILACLGIRDAIALYIPPSLPTCDTVLPVVFAVVLVVVLALTLASGVQYMWKNRDLLAESHGHGSSR